MLDDEWKKSVDERLLHLEGEASGFEEFVRGTLASHTAILGQLVAGQNEHTAILERHGAILERHTAILERFSGMLEQVTTAVVQLIAGQKDMQTRLESIERRLRDRY